MNGYDDDDDVFEMDDLEDDDMGDDYGDEDEDEEGSEEAEQIKTQIDELLQGKVAIVTYRAAIARTEGNHFFDPKADLRLADLCGRWAKANPKSKDKLVAQLQSGLAELEEKRQAADDLLLAAPAECRDALPILRQAVEAYDLYLGLVPPNSDRAAVANRRQAEDTIRECEGGITHRRRMAIGAIVLALLATWGAGIGQSWRLYRKGCRHSEENRWQDTIAAHEQMTGWPLTLSAYASTPWVQEMAEQAQEAEEWTAKCNQLVEDSNGAIDVDDWEAGAEKYEELRDYESPDLQKDVDSLAERLRPYYEAVEELATAEKAAKELLDAGEWQRVTSPDGPIDGFLTQYPVAFRRYLHKDKLTRLVVTVAAAFEGSLADVREVFDALARAGTEPTPEQLKDKKDKLDAISRGIENFVEGRGSLLPSKGLSKIVEVAVATLLEGLEAAPSHEIIRIVLPFVARWRKELSRDQLATVLCAASRALIQKAERSPRGPEWGKNWALVIEAIGTFVEEYGADLPDREEGEGGEKEDLPTLVDMAYTPFDRLDGRGHWEECALCSGRFQRDVDEVRDRQGVPQALKRIQSVVDRAKSHGEDCKKDLANAKQKIAGGASQDIREICQLMRKWQGTYDAKAECDQLEREAKAMATKALTSLAEAKDWTPLGNLTKSLARIDPPLVLKPTVDAAAQQITQAEDKVQECWTEAKGIYDNRPWPPDCVEKMRKLEAEAGEEDPKRAFGDMVSNITDWRIEIEGPVERIKQLWADFGKAMAKMPEPDYAAALKCMEDMAGIAHAEAATKASEMATLLSEKFGAGFKTALKDNKDYDAAKEWMSKAAQLATHAGKASETNPGAATRQSAKDTKKLSGDLTKAHDGAVDRLKMALGTMIGLAEEHIRRVPNPDNEHRRPLDAAITAAAAVAKAIAPAGIGDIPKAIETQKAALEAADPNKQLDSTKTGLALREAYVPWSKDVEGDWDEEWGLAIAALKMQAYDDARMHFAKAKDLGAARQGQAAFPKVEIAGGKPVLGRKETLNAAGALQRLDALKREVKRKADDAERLQSSLKPDKAREAAAAVLLLDPGNCFGSGGKAAKVYVANSEFLAYAPGSTTGFQMGARTQGPYAKRLSNIMPKVAPREGIFEFFNAFTGTEKLSAKLQPFVIAKRLVSVKQYCAFLNEAKRAGDITEDDIRKYVTLRDRAAGSREGEHAPQIERRDGVHTPAADAELPLTHVSWDGANAYCEWLSRKPENSAMFFEQADDLLEAAVRHLRLKWDLPTEVQWEFAAAWRKEAGLKPLFPAGDELPYDHVGTPRSAPWPVKSPEPKPKTPNDKADVSQLGCLHMATNVRQWVYDWYARAFPPRLAPDNKGPRGGDEKVIRGGSFEQGPQPTIRRWKENPAAMLKDVGFRVVVEVSPK